MDPASLICVNLYYIFSSTIFDFHSGSAIYNAQKLSSRIWMTTTNISSFY